MQGDRCIVLMNRIEVYLNYFMLVPMILNATSV